MLKKIKLALVGTGIRGVTFWGRNIAQKYADVAEFVGLCDINPGRLDFAKSYIGVDCPVFTDFDEMLAKTDADMVMVTTMDSTHHEFIVKALKAGKEVVTEKPLTTDEVKCKAILDHYGKNNPFRGEKCRGCEHFARCKYHFDITGSKMDMDLYVANEGHDGYIRDSCLWRNEIDIYDKMSAQIKYANNVLVNYSLTTYSPYEGMKIAFNGQTGRIDAWDGIPWRKQEKIKIPKGMGGHGGGDQVLQDRIFRNPEIPDPMHHSAGTRDGAFSCIIGIAARKSIEEGRPVKIAELLDIKSQAKRPV